MFDLAAALTISMVGFHVFVETRYLNISFHDENTTILNKAFKTILFSLSLIHFF